MAAVVDRGHSPRPGGGCGGRSTTHRRTQGPQGMFLSHLTLRRVHSAHVRRLRGERAMDGGWHLAAGREKARRRGGEEENEAEGEEKDE